MASFSMAKGPVVTVPPATTLAPTISPATVPPEGITLGADGLGVISVGEPQASALSAMTSYLGPPTAPASGYGACPGRTEVQWGDLSLEFSSHTFVGYRYSLGGFNRSYPVSPVTPLLRTATGATLEMTLAQVRALYPPSDFSEEHGGSIVVDFGPADQFTLIFYQSSPSTPLQQIKGGETCGDF
jgi:hypothetical protein